MVERFHPVLLGKEQVMLPIDFYPAKEELARFCAAQARRAFLVIEGEESAPGKERLPEGLVPFMVVEEPSWPDIYAFDSSVDPAEIVVWSDHAIVQRWDSFESFLGWIRSFATKSNA